MSAIHWEAVQDRFELPLRHGLRAWVRQDQRAWRWAIDNGENSQKAEHGGIAATLWAAYAAAEDAARKENLLRE